MISFIYYYTIHGQINPIISSIDEKKKNMDFENIFKEKFVWDKHHIGEKSFLETFWSAISNGKRNNEG